MDFAPVPTFLEISDTAFSDLPTAFVCVMHCQGFIFSCPKCIPFGKDGLFYTNQLGRSSSHPRAQGAST